jgi:hypothetical protein
MKKFLLLTLLLAGCAQTSQGLVKAAMKECKTTPELDGQQLYCAASYIMEECQEKNLDLRICGEVDRNR